MLQRLDRILLAVRDRAAAADTFAAVLGAEQVRADHSDLLAAHRTVLHAGTSEIELLEPAGDGSVRAFIQRWGEGLFGVGFATPDLRALATHLSDRRIQWREEAGRLHIAPDQTCGLRAVISPSTTTTSLGGIRYIYEVTNLVSDWQQAATRYADIFGLDAQKFHPLSSHEFGYTGALTLFNPPAQLDRIELSQPTESDKSMGRFFAKRGPSLYMCYAESDDVGTITARLDRRGMRWASGHDTGAGENVFIHPSGLHGLLMGISRTNLAWTWSGRPDLAAVRA
ncbi:MAG: VOC family protein [Deltaproteobacteria bacterium]|nr:VOC family protein [Deltaproteobacteria bacterium]MBI3387345.1 VOC family protein [Deltaproteobacteria bacterium]